MPEVNSFYANMLLAIQQRMAEAVPEVRYTEQDFGQLEVQDAQGRPPVSFPCALIDFDNTKYDQLSELVEMGDCTFRIRIGYAPFSSSNSLAPLDVRKKALEYYEIEQKVYKALKGWYAMVTDNTGTYAICQPLNRINDGTEKREDTLRVRFIDFTTSFQDAGAAATYTIVNPTLQLQQNMLPDN